MFASSSADIFCFVARFFLHLLLLSKSSVVFLFDIASSRHSNFALLSCACVDLFFP